MRILITNDDGILGPGLTVLERIAARLSDDVWTVAPETDQSGFAHSLTLSNPLRIRELGGQRYAVAGTPTDCVIMAVRQILDRAPDLVLSGVNAGANMADDITYSGTVAGAIEGTLLGIPSIALSQAYNHADGAPIPFDIAETHAPDVIARVLDAGIPRGTLVNVNFPASRAAGVEVTRQGAESHGLTTEARIDSRRRPYYWLAYSRSDTELVPGTDIHAIREGRISVTPLRLDMTDPDGLDRLGRAFG
jgi:5'-nucleotidase